MPDSPTAANSHMDTAHREKYFENHIVERLVAHGWRVGDSHGYDTERALYASELTAWLKATQPAKWEKIQADYPEDPAGALMDRVARALDRDGTVQALRRGFDSAGLGHIDLSEAAPEDQRNEGVLARYAANHLMVVPQLKYHPVREFAIDLVFFINGLPVATVEVKTDFTQSADAAVAQYKRDRLPVDPKTKRREPLLTFKRGAVVHFAVSETDIQMATKLAGEDTFFLPFNCGHDGHAGNPTREDGEYPVAYFWEEVCKPDAWLRIFHSFVYVEKKNVVDLAGNWKVRETLIFPRFHQWSAVNAMIADAHENGPGQQYLCEHSAGSGKTSTIAWTAHDLVKLRHDNGAAVFDSVVIVTDRTVLDDQLQEAVKQIDHQFGVIEAIDRKKGSASKSKRLANALLAGVPIIVVTIQTFPYAMEAILTESGLKGKNFAVIIDEAHNSQTGTNAAKLAATLSLSNADEMAQMSVEELLEALQKARVQPANVSHFAFTATPKHSTLTLFGRTRDGGRPTKENPPLPFHKYPMRQAIEEGFILDVLRGYTPYKTAFNLAKEQEDKRRVSSKAAKRALAQWMSLHPTNVTQKVQFVVEHFARNVASLLNGNAKAMVVTSSRAAAVRYKRGFDAFVVKHPEYSHIHSLVAFSGKLTGSQVKHADDDRISGDTFLADDTEEFTETSMNPAAGGQDLRAAFDRPEYRVMIVADKFQTGFDQPKLVAMYVDKKIANDVEIVQTFSRLNRTAPGKDTTYIIDFVNDPENVLRAFALYDDGATLSDVQDPDVVYDIKKQLDDAGLYTNNDVEAFKQARFANLAHITSVSGTAAHKALFAATQAPTDRYNAKKKALREAIASWEVAFEQAHTAGNEAGMKEADHKREELAGDLKALTEFKSGLLRFTRTYGYIAQVIDFADSGLENFAAFARLLAKRLDGVPSEDVDLAGLMLAGFDIKPKDQPVPGEGDETGEDPPTLNPIKVGAAGQAEKPEYLQKIIRRLNEIFGDATPLGDQAHFVNQVASIARESDIVRAQVANNPRAQALKGNLPGAVRAGLVRALSSHQKLATQMLKQDAQGMSALIELVYELIHDERSIDVDGLGG
ncbi:type I restriction endonuclease subunit R [Castellaniella sp.]|uniref:type I restriction endonuclease subunit R n=1 Tax=Castellaniella sp. TaxID=1955812 RepID=UPI003C7959F8